MAESKSAALPLGDAPTCAVLSEDSILTSGRTIMARALARNLIFSQEKQGGMGSGIQSLAGL